MENESFSPALFVNETSEGERQEFKIEEYSDHVKICAYLSFDAAHAEIPSEIHGRPVTIIDGDCFFNCKIETISIPDSVEVIGVQAFAMCKYLTEVTLPDSVREIGILAFRDCSSLQRFVFPDSLEAIPDGIFSFSYLHGTDITLPSRLKEIGDNAFYTCSVDLVIPDTVEKIGVGAFAWGPSVTTSLLQDEGWFRMWPYGEKVISDKYGIGTIAEDRTIEGNCTIFTVKFSEDIRKQFFFPEDFNSGSVRFEEHTIYEHFVNRVKDSPNTGIIYNNWRRGLI